MMTKKERAAIDAKIKALRIRAALCWSDEYLPDVPIPEGGELSKGWLPTLWDGGAQMACSSTVYHGTGRWDRTTSQGPRRLYSTKLLALLACRHAAALDAATKLASIDELIEAELAEASSTPSK